MDNSEQKVIAAFDFDGTITTKDTLIDFLLFYFGKQKVLLGFLYLSPMLIMFKLKFIKNDRAKELLLSYFFKNVNIGEFNKKCVVYSDRINTICRATTIDKIKWHLRQNHKVIIISASIKNWIEPWALKNGINEVLSTEICIENGKITGTLKNKNCYGVEKTNRLLERYPSRESYTLYAYGDSRGDKELLELADYPTLIK